MQCHRVQMLGPPVFPYPVTSKKMVSQFLNEYYPWTWKSRTYSHHPHFAMPQGTRVGPLPHPLSPNILRKLVSQFSTGDDCRLAPAAITHTLQCPRVQELDPSLDSEFQLLSLAATITTGAPTLCNAPGCKSWTPTSHPSLARQVG